MAKQVNPKILYLASKNLLRTLPKNKNELLLRACYEERVLAKEDFEKDIIAIKHFLEGINPITLSIKEIETLYETCTKKTLVLNDVPNIRISGVDNVIELAKFVMNIDCDHNMLFQILLLCGYYKQYETYIIPYRYTCESILIAVYKNDFEQVKELYFRLLTKTEKYSIKHDVELNVLAKAKVYEYKNEFLSRFCVNYLAIHGSLASGEGNEFSDLDLLLIVDNSIDRTEIKRQALNYWKEKIDIPIDIAVFNECNIPFIPIGMQQTAKFI